MKSFKNVQIIDGAENCTYDLFETDEGDFLLIFPGPGQDVEFVDDFVARVGESEARRITEHMWRRRVDKKTAGGIHGTLFYGLDFKKKFYPTKRESEMVTGVGPSRPS